MYPQVTQFETRQRLVLDELAVALAREGFRRQRARRLTRLGFVLRARLTALGVSR
jgi:hypothetical protein